MADDFSEKLRKIAERACQREACGVQSCLQANNYKEEFCAGEIEKLKKCCSKLKPDILKYSVRCSGFINSLTDNGNRKSH
jgi:hypothetical protein